MSYANRPHSEFLGLHDPYADAPVGIVAPRAPAAPLLDKEKRAELLRAGASLSVLFMLIAVVITAIG